MFFSQPSFSLFLELIVSPPRFSYERKKDLTYILREDACVYQWLNEKISSHFRDTLSGFGSETDDISLLYLEGDKYRQQS